MKELESELRRVERGRDVFTLFTAHIRSTALAFSAATNICSLTMLMDLFSRRMVGWQLSEDMAEQLVLSALHQPSKNISRGRI